MDYVCLAMFGITPRHPLECKIRLELGCHKFYVALKISGRLKLIQILFYFRQINQNNSVTPSQVLYCTPEDAWEQFQTLLSKHNPFWNLTSYHDTYGVSERRSSVLFVSVSFIVLMVISITWLVLYYVQRFRYIHAKDRLERRLCVQAKRALAIIPIITISKDEHEEDEDHCPGKL